MTATFLQQHPAVPNRRAQEAPADGPLWTPWRILAAILAVAACVAVARESWGDLITMAFHDEENSHVLLVPLGVAWLVSLRWHSLGSCRPRGMFLGTVFLAVGWVLWSVGYRHQVESFWHGGAVLMAVGGLLSVVGEDVFLRLLPAFGLLVFLVPVPATGRQLIALPLQHATAELTQRAAEVLGMSVTRQGNLLNVNGTDVAVVEACNGMRMVFTLLFACYVFAFVTPLPNWGRFFILAASPVVAIVCNVVRLVPTIYVFGHFSTAAAEKFHDAAGWAMLFIAFGVLLGSVRLMRWALESPPQHPAGPQITAGMGADA